MNNDYEEIYHNLRKEKLVAWLLVEPNGHVSGIDVDCPGIDGLERTKKIMDIVGSSYRVVMMPNEGIIKVEKK